MKFAFVIAAVVLAAAAEEYILPEFKLPCSGSMTVHNEFSGTNISYIWSNGFSHRYDTLYNLPSEKGNLEYIRRPDVSPSAEYNFIDNNLIKACESIPTKDWRTDSSTYPDYVQDLRGHKFENRTRSKYNGRIVDIYESKFLYLQRITIDVETGLCWLYEEFKAEHQEVRVLSYKPNAKVIPNNFSPVLKHCSSKYSDAYTLPSAKDIAC